MNLSPEKAVDPRVLRTRRLLEDALAALLDRRAYASITVKAIAAEARVNRATFYAHFVDKDELFRTFLRNSFDRVVAERLGDARATEPFGRDYLDVLIPAVFEHADWLAGKCRGARSRRTVPPPEGELQVQLEEIVLRCLEVQRGRADAAARETLALAVSAMTASVATRWSRSAKRPPMGTVVGQLREMVDAAIGAVIAEESCA